MLEKERESHPGLIHSAPQNNLPVEWLTFEHWKNGYKGRSSSLAWDTVREEVLHHLEQVCRSGKPICLEYLTDEQQNHGNAMTRLATDVFTEANAAFNEISTRLLQIYAKMVGAKEFGFREKILPPPKIILIDPAHDHHMILLRLSHIILQSSPALVFAAVSQDSLPEFLKEIQNIVRFFLTTGVSSMLLNPRLNVGTLKIKNHDLIVGRKLIENRLRQIIIAYNLLQLNKHYPELVKGLALCYPPEHYRFIQTHLDNPVRTKKHIALLKKIIPSHHPFFQIRLWTLSTSIENPLPQWKRIASFNLDHFDPTSPLQGNINTQVQNFIHM